MNDMIESSGLFDGIFGGNRGCGGNNNFFTFFILIIVLCFVFGRDRGCGCGREHGCDCRR